MADENAKRHSQGTRVQRVTGREIKIKQNKFFYLLVAIVQLASVNRTISSHVMLIKCVEVPIAD